MILDQLERFSMGKVQETGELLNCCFSRRKQHTNEQLLFHCMTSFANVKLFPDQRTAKVPSPRDWFCDRSVISSWDKLPSRLILPSRMLLSARGCCLQDVLQKCSLFEVCVLDKQLAAAPVCNEAAG